jgi:hypothetical protein
MDVVVEVSDSECLLIFLLLGDLSSKSFNHHVKFNLIEESTIIEVQNTEKVFKPSSISLLTERKSNLIKALLQFSLLQFIIFIEIKFGKDLCALLDIIEITLTNHNEEHKFVQIKISTLIIVS